MKRLGVWVLLASLPLGAYAQQGPMLDQHPFKGDSFTAPPPVAEPSGQSTTPPDDITAAPLPPPDQAPPPDQTDTQQEMVPNPLDDQNAKPGAAPGKPPQPVGQVQRGTWVQMGTATLQALDKVNARVNTLVVKVGDVTHFGSLDIGVRGCFVRAPDRPADATAFLVVRDRHADTPAFTGWMIRSAPYMSMMANPIYDIRVAGCSP